MKKICTKQILTDHENDSERQYLKDGLKSSSSLNAIEEKKSIGKEWK